MENFLSKIRTFAHRAHTGQKYGDQPYMSHVEEVVEETTKILTARDMTNDLDFSYYIAVAYGHDVIEDSNIKIDELLFADIPIDVVNGIDAMTKRNYETREEYIMRVKMDKYARLVKQADSLRNLTHSIRDGNVRRIAKYTNYLNLLSE